MSRIVDTIRRDPSAEEPRKEHRPSARRGEPLLGAVQYFHKDDRETVEQVLRGLEGLPVRHLRTAISWCDWTSPGGEQWYEWILPQLLERFDVLPCFLYTPPELGILPKTSSPPRDPQAYGEFVAMVLERYAANFSHVELWNEPNNYIEWDWTIDPEWKIFAEMIAGAASRARALGVKPVLGGMSPFDPNWLDLMFKRGAMVDVDVVGVHGFPGTWEAVWEGWDSHIARVQEVLDRHGSEATVWVTEAGFSTWAHDEFRQLRTMVDLAEAPADRVYWYSVQDLAPERETLDGFHADERAYHFGFLRRGAKPKLLARVLADEGLAGVRDLVRFAAEDAEARAASGSAGPSDATLILGGAGFLGHALADRLASQNEPVTVLDSLARPGAERSMRLLKEKHGPLVRVEPGDVRDVFALRRGLAGCATVFHLAVPVEATPEAALDVVARSTVLLLEEIARLPQPPAVVLASSAAVYGELGDVELRADGAGLEPRDPELAAHGVSERRPLEPAGPLAAAQAAAELQLLAAARRLPLAGCALRLGEIVGDDGAARLPAHGEAAVVRDPLHVSDAAEALLAAARSAPQLGGRAFNVGAGPAGAIGLGEAGAPLTGSAAPRWYVADTRAFRAATGWSPAVEARERLAGAGEHAVAG